MLWHAGTGQELATFSTQSGPVGDLRFADDSRSLGAAIVKEGKAALYIWSSR